MKNVFLTILIIIGVGTHNVVNAEQACFNIEGMTCATCGVTVKSAVNKLNGINSVKASLDDKSAVVDYDSHQTSASQIIKAIDNVGYKAMSKTCKNNKG